jgi:hypothetical protein
VIPSSKKKTDAGELALHIRFSTINLETEHICLHAYTSSNGKNTIQLTNSSGSNLNTLHAYSVEQKKEET